MPNDGSNLNPALFSSLLGPKGLWNRRYIKSEPLLVGIAWFVLLQAVGMAIGTSGRVVDPVFWRCLSLGGGAVAFVISRAHVAVLGLRLLGLRFYFLLGITDKASYMRMRKSVEQAFVDRVVDPADYSTALGGGKR
jgi:hypothetical protein